MCKLFRCANVQISHMWIAAYKDAMGVGIILKKPDHLLKKWVYMVYTFWG